MSTDRELLELAARAAQLEVKAANYSPKGMFMSLDIKDGEVYEWNPLRVSDDALDLMDRCQISVTHEGMDGYSATDHNYLDEPVVERGYEMSSLSCMRRAIVRAAAEIGRSMT